MKSIKKSFGSKLLPNLNKERSNNLDEFFMEDKKREDPIALTIENEDNFENVVIKEEIKRELRSSRFWVMIIIASLQNISLLYFYMNFKFIILKNFEDDLFCTKLATFIEFIGRMAKINSKLLFEIISLEAIFYAIYSINLVKNVVFIFWGSNLVVFVQLYIVQKILEGFYYIYNFVFIFKKFENKGSFLMKIYELHKLLSLLLSTLVVVFVKEQFEFEKIVGYLVVVDILGLLLRQSE